MNEKIIRFPFQRHINYSIYMRKNKGLPLPERKISENGYNNNVVDIALYCKCR